METQKTTYETNGWIKYSEEGIYQDGCLPETLQRTTSDLAFRADTLPELLNEIKAFFGVDDECIELDSCGEIGRLDVAADENEDGYPISDAQFQDWKRGLHQMYSATYIFKVKKVTREAVRLS